MPAAPQQGNQGDHSGAILWGVAATFAGLGMLWYAFKDYIVLIYLTIKLYEVNFLSLFNASYFQPVQAALERAIANPNAIKFTDLANIGAAAGDILRYPFGLILLLLAVFVYTGNVTRVFKRVYNMRDLAKLEKSNWPQISPVIDLDLIKTDIDKGPWAMAMTPMQFCKRNKLLEEVRPQRREGMTRREWNKIDVVLKRGEANRIFALQLGPVWKGPDKLPGHTRALFAVFAARINADSEAAAALLKQLNFAAAKPRVEGQDEFLKVEGLNELINKHFNSKLVQQIVQSHAYVLTVMASMLEAAREDGVQASADFLWLKPKDRRLWYILNTVGRQTPFAEVAGVYAHWLAEKEAGKKMLVPMVEEATKALEIALKEVVYHPDEETETNPK